MKTEKLHISYVDPKILSSIDMYDNKKILWAIGFWSYQREEYGNLPFIVSHEGYRDDNDNYQTGTAWPLHIFSVDTDAKIHSWEIAGITYRESEDFVVWSREIDEKDVMNGDDLMQITESIYQGMYEVMQKTGKKNLVRVGNYVSDIVGETQITVDGKQITTNRYKAFCTGRSYALDKSFLISWVQLPTATWIWNQCEPKGVRLLFIATKRTDVEHHKNPKQTNPELYNTSKHGIPQITGQASAPKFNRWTSITNDQLLFIGGTASILWQEVVHVGDIQKQTAQALANISYVIEEAEKNTGCNFHANPLLLKVFIKHKDDYEKVKEVIEKQQVLSNPIVWVVYTKADVCRDQRLVEISWEVLW